MALAQKALEAFLFLVNNFCFDKDDSMAKLEKIIGAAALWLPALACAQGALENPANNATDSGIGIISGWHCSATRVEAIVDGKSIGFAYVGSERMDTASICGKSNTGFALLINFNNLSRGAHNLKIYANGALFGESNFKTTQSGGTAFLTNKSRTVDVVDFPSPGATATLSWSESKQSFVVTNINTNPNPPVPVPTGLAKLYGRVAISYHFDYSGSIYSESFSFSSANYNQFNNELTATVDGKNKEVSCAVINQAGYEFVCSIKEPRGARDSFLFNVSASGALAGRFEYCPPSVSDYDCGSGLVLHPDGSVAGNVAARTAGLGSPSAAAASAPESKDQLKARQLQREAQTPSTQSATPEQLDAVREALERLSP